MLLLLHPLWFLAALGVSGGLVAVIPAGLSSIAAEIIRAIRRSRPPEE